MGHGLRERTTALGEEDAFPRPRLSARCRFSQGTFAGTRGNGRDAPAPAIREANVQTAVEPGFSANVKITPLGSHDGEFCALDRAMVFEDPDRTRILYDAGRTVRGPDDRRLGKIDGVLLSHVHSDHLGYMHSSGEYARDQQLEMARRASRFRRCAAAG
jgi:hypothetical protein